jgi:cytidylate kinase
MADRILAVSGLCGAGKSTAARFLAKATGGEMVYFGATVLRVGARPGPPGN